MTTSGTLKPPNDRLDVSVPVVVVPVDDAASGAAARFSLWTSAMSKPCSPPGSCLSFQPMAGITDARSWRADHVRDPLVAEALRPQLIDSLVVELPPLAVKTSVLGSAENGEVLQPVIGLITVEVVYVLVGGQGAT